MENLNSCCYIAKINEVNVIEGADNIELVVAGGWNAITQKGEFKVGDITIIATTDAVIPETLSEDMEVTSYLRKGNRVRTVKLRGVYSECLIIPTYYLKGRVTMGDYDLVEGTDCMGFLNISKYEPPIRQIQLAGGKKVRYNDNPNFHVYYKFPNLKNVPDMFAKGDLVEITRKIHGTNARYGIVKKLKVSLWDKVRKFFRLTDEWVDYEYVYGSHNVEKGSDSNGFYSTDVWSEIEKKYDIKNKLWDYARKMGVITIGDGVTLYGEIYGAGIQKGYDYGLKDIEFVGFDLKEYGEYLDTYAAYKVITYYLELPYVERLYYGNWSQIVQDSFVFNNFIEGTKVPHEGIVIKYYTGERQKIAKVINPDYLIYAEKNNVSDSH